MSILVINAGSSSVKFGLFRCDDLEPITRGLLDWAGQKHRATINLTPRHGDPIQRELEAAGYREGVEAGLRIVQDSDLANREVSVRAVGHRLIHGGEEIREPVRIDAAMKQTIARFAPLAPLHIPPGLEAIEAAEAAFPNATQVGVFDTAFFGNIPEEAYIYPVPYDWYKDWGIRRFGFHGTSHAYCAGRAAEMLGCDPSEPRLVICHLGQGSSATAVAGGVAIANTMGFTPLEGLPMGSRCGTLDPGILLYVQREMGIGVEQLDRILHHESGLLGISGVSSDYRRIEAVAAEGNERAQLALRVHAYHIKTTIGSLAAAAGGLDALVFTGGIGENATRLRADVCHGLEFLGVSLDENRNAHCVPDAQIATDDSKAQVLVIHTQEDLLIARESRHLAEYD